MAPRTPSLPNTAYNLWRASLTAVTVVRVGVVIPFISIFSFELTYWSPVSVWLHIAVLGSSACDELYDNFFRYLGSSSVLHGRRVVVYPFVYLVVVSAEYMAVALYGNFFSKELDYAMGLLAAWFALTCADICLCMMGRWALRFRAPRLDNSQDHDEPSIALLSDDNCITEEIQDGHLALLWASQQQTISDDLIDLGPISHSPTAEMSRGPSSYLARGRSYPPVDSPSPSAEILQAGVDAQESCPGSPAIPHPSLLGKSGSMSPLAFTVWLEVLSFCHVMVGVPEIVVTVWKIQDVLKGDVDPFVPDHGALLFIWYCGLILTPLGLIAWPLPAAVVILKRIPPAALVIRNRTCRELLGFWVLIVFGVNSVGTMVAIMPYTIGQAVFLREGKTIPPAVIRWDERFALCVLFALILHCLTIAIMHPRSYEYLRARIGRLKVRRRWGPI